MDVVAFVNSFEGYQAAYGNGMSDHLPMALVALHRIGASDRRLEEFAATYLPRLERLPPTPAGKIDADSWRDQLGTHQRYPEYRAFFTSECETLGREACLRKCLPSLVPGLFGAAFHGAIRTGYGVLTANDPEIAAGLAYLADAYLPLGSLPEPVGGTLDPTLALEDIAAKVASGEFDLGRARPIGNIFQRMGEVSRLEFFPRAVATLAWDLPLDLAAFSRAALRLHATREDFTVLHMVTGLHALRLLSPYVKVDPRTMGHLWQALCAAYLIVGAFPLDPAPSAARSFSWDEIMAKAVAGRDEHAMKLAFSAREEHLVYGDDLYLAVAARKVGLVPAR